MFDCGPLRRHLTVAEDYASFWSMNIWQDIIRNHCIDIFSQSYLVPGYPASGSWPSRQCQAWASSGGVGLKFDQSLVGHAHKFCSTFTPAYLAGRANCGLKFFGWVGVSIPPVEVFPDYIVWPIQMPYSPLLGLFSGVTLTDSKGFHCTRFQPEP